MKMPKNAKLGKNGKPQMNPKMLMRLIKLLFKDYPGRLALIFVCIILVAVVGVMPAIYIENVTALIVDGLELAKTSGAADAWKATYPLVLQKLLTMVGLYSVGILCGLLREQLMATVTQGFLDKMRRRMFDKMQDLPVKYFDTNTHGDIMSYYTNDIDALRQTIPHRSLK